MTKFEFPVVPSNRQVDNLGERLASPAATPIRMRVVRKDLLTLEAFRRSFMPSYDKVMRVVETELGLNPSGRPSKSTGAILAKLRRQTIRLSQMQDVAGCRLLVSNLREQDRVVATLKSHLAELGPVLIDDRRARPSFGYRAVHLVVRCDRLVEVQVRTQMQHLWAEFSESMAVIYGDEVKYGGPIVGEPELRTRLDDLSSAIAESEETGGTSQGALGPETQGSGDWYAIGALILMVIFAFLLKAEAGTASEPIPPLTITGDGPFFLVRYDRQAKRPLTVRRYAKTELDKAQVDKLAAEFDEPQLEVVLLEASSLEALEETHPRYFGSAALQHLSESAEPA